MHSCALSVYCWLIYHLKVTALKTEDRTEVLLIRGPDFNHPQCVHLVYLCSIRDLEFI